ncbi:MAG TPA: nucleotidyltransferase family protein [Blastocatellia bacterium]
MQLTVTDKLLLSCLLPTTASDARLRQLLAAEQGIDWPLAVRRADFHHIASLLRFNLARVGALDRLPVESQIQLREISQTWAARHLAYVSEAARLIAMLREEGLTAIPLKGAALMLGEYYPQAGLRAATDIDLLADPYHLERADEIVAGNGYAHLPGKRSARPRQRLANDLNHLWPRRSPGGLILELHHRAFQYARRERDFSFAEVNARAVRHDAAGVSLLLPSPTDLAFHLVHHTLVDLQTTRAIWRTIADLHFIFAREPKARDEMKRQAGEFGFAGAAMLADEIERLLAGGTLDELDEAVEDERLSLLFETAWLDDSLPVADAARLFEYFDFGRKPMAKLGNLFSLLFTSREHLTQLYGPSAQGSVYVNYLRRPFDLLRKLNRTGLSPANLWRVWKLRKLASRGSDG